MGFGKFLSSLILHSADLEKDRPLILEFNAKKTSMFLYDLNLLVKKFIVLSKMEILLRCPDFSFVNLIISPHFTNHLCVHRTANHQACLSSLPSLRAPGGRQAESIKSFFVF